MFFQHIYDQSLAQASYFIACQKKKQAIVIDPGRDISCYLKIAKEQNVAITHIVETHIHADFLAGTPELAAATGGQIFLSKEGGVDWKYQYAHQGVGEGDVIAVGNLTLTVIHTPGHTPESISLLLRDHPASDEPVMIFTGDFVFVGDVGRPDLLEEAAGIQGNKEVSARELFASLQKFLALPDYIQVWPGHGAGSACGKSLGAVPSSTVGYEKLRNWALQFGKDEDGFVKELLAGQPEVPAYFSIMKIRNKQERKLYVPPSTLHEFTVMEVEQRKDILLVDTRDKIVYAREHVTVSINIPHKKSMLNWAGWLLPYDQPIVIIAPKDEQLEIVRKLSLIGMDNVIGALEELAGGSLSTVDIVDDQLVFDLKDDPNYALLDVRSISEYNLSHIPGALHYFLGHLPKADLTSLKAKKLIVQCQSGERATIAYSYLEFLGFRNMKLYLGSIIDWQQKGRALIA